MSQPPVHSGVDEVAAHPHHTGRQWLDMVLALSAIFISLVSLFVAIQHGKTEEKLVAASSWPFVVAGFSHTGLQEGSRLFTLSITNAGVGPARVQTARILLDGKPVHSRLQLLSLCCGYAGGDVQAQIRDGLRSDNPLVGVLAPRDEIEVLAQQQTPSSLAQWARLSAIRPRLTLFACYCSVLNECWTTDLHPTSSPRPVHDCRPDPDDYTD